MKKIKIAIVLLVCFFISIPAYCNEDKQTSEGEEIFTQNAKKAGIIFNVSDILLDIESYQGGVGFKWFFTDSFAYRGSFDFGYSDSSSSLNIKLGNSLEYHFILPILVRFLI
jgi:hypothetical protein